MECSSFRVKVVNMECSSFRGKSGKWTVEDRKGVDVDTAADDEEDEGSPAKRRRLSEATEEEEEEEEGKDPSCYLREEKVG